MILRGSRSLNLRRSLGILCFVTSVFVSHASHSDLILISSTDQGWYNDTGEHTASNRNYFTGAVPFEEYRSFFVFDLSAVSGPIASATLNLSIGTRSSTAETLVLRLPTMSSYSLADLTSSHDGDSEGLSIFTDLADGTVIATREFPSGETGSVSIPLNADFIAEANNLAGGSASIVLGGAIGSLSSADDDTEYLFANTDDTTTALQLDVIPEPGSLSAMLLVLLLAVSQRVPKRSV